MDVSVFSVVGDKKIDASRTALANQVIDNLCPSLPKIRIAVILDSGDWYELRERGPENRGAFFPVNVERYNPTEWPLRLRKFLLSVDATWKTSLTCEGVVYLHNSTCEVSASLVMTLAHELQHAIQYATNQTIWAYNGVVTNWLTAYDNPPGLEWKDIPIEREARIAAKRVCEEILGRDTTDRYIEDRIANGTIPRDIADWRFIRTIDTATESTYETSAETGRLLHRIEKSRSQLEKVLDGMRRYPEFKTLNLANGFELS